MGFKGWLKTWGALLTAIFALGLSGYALHLDDVHFKESMAQSQYATQHEQIYDKLVRLDTKIERAKELIHLWASFGDNTTDLQNILRIAEIGRNEAEQAWLNNDYSKVDNLINQAYDSLDEIPLPPVVNFRLIIGIAAAIIVIGAIAWVVLRRRVEGFNE